MYIPLLTKRQRGGGGFRGGGGISTGGGRGSSGGSTRGTTASSRPPPYSPGSAPPPYSVGGGAAVRGNPGAQGGGSPYTVAPGNAFAGRSAGGGTRGNVYAGRGFGGGALVGAAAFPFIFWPLAFSGGYGNYYGSRIYGPPNNDTRPGGELISWTLLPDWAEGTTTGSPGPEANTFALYGDVASVSDLVPILAESCGVVDDTAGQNLTATPDLAVQYYRGSSFSLLLEGYDNGLPNIETDPSNDTTLPDNIANAQPAPLPNGVNSTYLNCLNATIGAQIGLLDSENAQDVSAGYMTAPASFQATAALLLLVWSLL